MKLTKSYLKDLTYKVNGAAIEVHKELGRGLLEKVYHHCLLHELYERKITCVSEYRIPDLYKGTKVKADLICDLFVENILPVELKAVESITPLHQEQLLTYMKLLKAPKGVIYNFNVNNLYHEGQKNNG